MVNRGLAPMSLVPGRDHDYAALREKNLSAQVPCEWVESTHPSYTLYTSGTTGKPLTTIEDPSALQQIRDLTATWQSA